MAKTVQEQVREAGVVGAGGAGFPAHVKLGARVHTYILNAAECEPLLCKDHELLTHEAETVIRGLRICMESSGATRGVVAIKAKYTGPLAALEPHLAGLDVVTIDDFYPAGDEFVTVFDVTGERIPPGGLPLDIGCAVNNVETAMNIARAVDGLPVTDKTLTVAGAVRRPVTVTVPLGTSLDEVLALAGGATVPDIAVMDGGAMMGEVVLDLARPVTKTSAGYIVLPRDHKLIHRRTLPEKTNVQISKSACDQCMYCTELCPRYLLGYAIEPHKVMRSVGFAGEREEQWAQLGLQCCECGICDLYACPEDLPPRDMCVRSKRVLGSGGRKPELLPARDAPHPLRDSRRVPTPRLIQRLGLDRWDLPAPLERLGAHPRSVRLLLSQHIGAPAEPAVKAGTEVRRGQLVAKVPAGQLGAPVHSSIAGTVAAVEKDCIIVESLR